MVINFWTKNEWWNNTIQRDVKLPFTKGPYIDSRQFHNSFARSGLIEYETTGRREFQCGSFTFHPCRERHIGHVLAILLVSHMALGGSLVRDNMLLKAFVLSGRQNRIPHSEQVL